MSTSGHSELDQRLDDFAQKAGLPRCEPPALKELLELSPAQLRNLSPGECLENAFLLRRLALHLQRELNRQQAHVRNSEENVKFHLRKFLGQIMAQGLEEKRLRALELSPEAQKSDRNRQRYQLYLDELAYTAQRVDGLAQALILLAREKRNELFGSDGASSRLA